LKKRSGVATHLRPSKRFYSAPQKRYVTPKGRQWQTRGPFHSYETADGHLLTISLSATDRFSLKYFIKKPRHSSQEGNLEIRHDGVLFNGIPDNISNREFLASIYQHAAEAWREEAFTNAKTHSNLKASLPVFLQYLYDHLEKH